MGNDGARRRWPLLLAWTGLWLAAGDMSAMADDGIEPLLPYAHALQVPDAELAELRGGFMTSDGLDIHFGLEQIVMVDGELKTRTSLNLSSLQSASATPQQIDQNKVVRIVQNGDRNIVSPDVAEKFSTGLLNVIQNSLDTQTIQNLTVLNIGVSNLSSIPQRALGNAVDVGLASALR